jgi:hypothetical protein
MRRTSLITLAVTALVVTLTSAAPASALAGHTVDQTIRAKTGASASRMTTPAKVGSISIGAGRSAGKALVSYTQTLDAKSARVLAVVEDASQSVVTYPVSLPAGTAVKSNADGSMIVVSGKDLFPQAVIEQPWAIDANGKALLTSYSFADGALTQKVDTAGAVFPVVVDPSIFWGVSVAAGWYNGPVWYIQFTRDQTKYIYVNIWQGPILSAVACAFTGPSALGCNIAFLYSFHYIEVESHAAMTVFHRCLKMRVPAAQNVWSSYIYTVYC